MSRNTTPLDQRVEILEYTLQRQSELITRALDTKKELTEVKQHLAELKKRLS